MRHDLVAKLERQKVDRNEEFESLKKEFLDLSAQNAKL